MNLTGFTDKVVIVTGASGGFGLATARAFAAAGAKVVLAARNAGKLRDAAKIVAAAVPAASPAASGTDATTTAIPCDVSDRDQVDQLVAQTLARHGRIDILVNNAGSGLIAPFETIRLEDAIALFETNFFGALHCTQAVLPVMKQQRAGHIVMMASVAGLRGIPNSSMYCASKAALIALADALRIELKPTGIHVTTLCPSRTTDTDFLAHAKSYGPIELYKVPDTLTTDHVVAALLDAVAKRKPLVILPLHARLMHILNKFAPRLLDRMLLRRMPKLTTTP